MGPAASFAFASRRGAAGGSGGPHSRRKCDISQPGDSLVRRRSDSVSNQPSRMVEKLSVVHPSCKELFDSAIKMHKRASYQQATYNQSWNKVQIIPSEGCVNPGCRKFMWPRRIIHSTRPVRWISNAVAESRSISPTGGKNGMRNACLLLCDHIQRSAKVLVRGWLK